MIVVGAGVAGLACAFRLQRAGIEILVLEREASPPWPAISVPSAERGFAVSSRASP